MGKKHYEDRNLKFETLQLHVGQEQPDPVTDARAVPIYLTSSYVFHNSQHAADRFGLKDAGNIYGRLTNPTEDVFEKRIAALEGGVAALAVGSGAAALTYAFQALAHAGDHIVAAKNIYGGTYNLLAHTLPDYGIEATFVDPFDYDAIEAAIKPNTKAVQIETLGNPNSEVVDINRDPSTLYFRVKVMTPSGERAFLIRNLILATGALDIQDRLIEKMIRSVSNHYEIGVRIEAPASAFGSTLSTHGDLKLKLGSGRTYCVTANGKIISYQTGGALFLEGSMDPFEATDYTNLAILIKYNDMNICDFIKQYYEKFRGLPVKQRFVDYINGRISTVRNSTINKLNFFFIFSLLFMF